MRRQLPDKIEKCRIKRGISDLYASYGLNGVFQIMGPCGKELRIISNDSTVPEVQGWEHVSVSAEKRAPFWLEMCFVKDLFWDEEEVVIQFHPPRAHYVNMHPYTLHLWRDTVNGHRVPDKDLV